MLLFVPFGKKLHFVVSYEFCHSTLLEVWSRKNRQADSVKEFILENIKQQNLSDEQHQLITQKVKQFIAFIKLNLPKCNRILERFKKNTRVGLHPI